MTSILLAVALVGQSAGQVVLLGRPGGLTDDEPAIVAATAEELVTVLTAPSSPEAREARAKPIPFGTRAEILSVVKLARKDAPERAEDGLRVRILDGPDADVEAVVRASWARPEKAAGTARTHSRPRRKYSRYHREYEAEVAENQAAMQAAMAKAEADYKAALPFLLEAQRQQLERLSAMERNAALQKMADADNRIADAIQYRTFVQGNR